jgi:hypothetical protein
MIDEKLRFDYKGVREPFHNLLVATGYKLEREWPNRYKTPEAGGAQMVLVQLVRLGVTIYKTIGFLCSDVEIQRALCWPSSMGRIHCAANSLSRQNGAGSWD